MGFEPMNNGFAVRRVSHFAIRAHSGPLMHCAHKSKTHCCRQWVRQDLETWSQSINPECPNTRLGSNNTCCHNRRAFASDGSSVPH